ncbi:MAG: Gfo/Idh/MocA family oxidoreductase [Gemmatimonadota bacterium]|nr:Gfo/Idh/MocA family oxidoreductase [Gemmatimonadota bacterium]
MGQNRVGIIGAGHIARSHARVWKAEAVLTAVCSRQYYRAEQLAKEFGIPVICSEADDLMARDDVDIICIATPHHLHHPFAIKAAEAGKHVFCEKPMALNAAQARDMWERGCKRGVKTGIQFSQRFRWPSLIYLREIVRKGDLGKIRHFEGSWAFDWAKSPAHPMSWRFRRHEAGTGALGDLGVYMIDAARWLVGEIDGVCGHLETVIKQRPVIKEQYNFAELRQMQEDEALPTPTETASVENDDICTVLIRFQNGAHGIIRANRMQRFNAIRVEGTEGVCTWDLQSAKLFHRPHGRESFAEVTIPTRISSSTMVSQFLANIRDDSDLPPTFYDGLKVQEVIDAAVRSNEERRWINA